MFHFIRASNYCPLVKLITCIYNCTLINSYADTSGPPPNMADLMNAVASEIPAEWRAVGIQLGLPSDILDGIQSQNAGKPKACQSSFEEVLTVWERQGPRPFTWRTMVDVLRTQAVGHTALANQLETTYIKSPH